MNKYLSQILLFACLFVFCSTDTFSQTNKKTVKKRRKLVGKEQTLPSGLKIILKEVGEGPKVDSGRVVKVHYTGKFTNDSVFDSSHKRGQPIMFRAGVGHVIKGWDEALMHLYRGDKATLIIPPQLGYGEKGAGPIPPNATLVFDIEVLEIMPKPVPFDVNGRDTIELEQGLKMIKSKENTSGLLPKKGSRITVHYSGYFEDGKLFDSSVERDQPFTFTLGIGNVIKGWDIAFEHLRTGEKARLIIPYQLGYGEYGYPGAIPPKANLIFDVEVIDVN
ncbi:MAG: peptidyl-prolyl cis-trans isomerase [Vicingaceae bacterium]|nr:MAG: peptidyl-prolyl cis-trans isomerase [Vicingaceae bacterium]